MLRVYGPGPVKRAFESQRPRTPCGPVPAPVTEPNTLEPGGVSRRLRSNAPPGDPAPMQTHRCLWPRLVAFDNLLHACKEAARGKRFRPDVAEFAFDLEANLCRLGRELRDGSYSPGDYRHFTLYDRGKPRLISAAPFRDRVVHHALCNLLEPIFEPTFIHDSYACRKGKGIHGAVDRFCHFAAGHHYVLKADIRRYFPSIRHEALLLAVGHKVRCRRTLALCSLILRHGVGDEEGHGLPIGNQTSQFLANVYLNGFDHFVLEQLKPAGYIRYVDDFVLFADDKAWLREALDQARACLAELGLQVPPGKCLIQPVAAGTTFLGYRLWPDRRRLVRSSVVRFRRRYRRQVRELQAGKLQPDRLRASVNGWLGHALHARSPGLIRDVLRP